MLIRQCLKEREVTLSCELFPPKEGRLLSEYKEIARKVKDTRDATFETVSNGITVNRCHGIASLGGSQQNSEEEYLINKMMRSLGVIAIDNQARV